MAFGMPDIDKITKPFMAKLDSLIDELVQTRQAMERVEAKLDARD